ncbi:hypothetical protein JTB14_004398 [Gonioctena quinquepunctata]|nr:hypothetical protein JTB14_004398 [Gonioctena quinquepunctata]
MWQEYGLYYDGSTGTYLKYNQDSQSYEFHSQVSTQEAQPVEQKSKIRKKRKNKCGSRNKDFKRQRGEENVQSTTKEFEEGECSDSGESSSEERADSDSSDISKQWPPCMRVIVETTECLKLKVGSLHIITCDGGTIGREGHHSILVPEINASKHHLKITFDKETGHYCAVDLGSRNGTLLNGKRISPSKQESAPVKMVHGSRLQIGSTVFLCHIHEGSQTCGHCEPGLLQSKDTENEKVAKTSKLEKHKNELKNLKMLCGVDKFEENPKLALGYTDRAQKRRQTVGSQNPHEKTEMASVDECINKENKGFKLLAKMGWKEGQSLGKGNEGLLEPVRLVSNKGTSGIGCSDTFEKVVPTEKHNVWKKTQERFEKLPNSNNAFEIDSED